MKRPFAGSVYLLGSGSLPRCVQALLVRQMPLLARRCVTATVAEARAAATGDLVIDLQGTPGLLNWCQARGILYLGVDDAGGSTWQPWEDSKESRTATTAVIDHVGYPGLFSQLTRIALRDLCRVTLRTESNHERRCQLEDALRAGDYAQLAQLLEVRVIHLCQHDTQEIVGEVPFGSFWHTGADEWWPVRVRRPAELAWGSHERRLPGREQFTSTGPGHALRLNRLACCTHLRSWTPAGRMVALLLAQPITLTLAQRLTVWHQGKAVYHPTICCLFGPSATSLASLRRQPSESPPVAPAQLLAQEIERGGNDLGVLLLATRRAWWTGSRLDIQQARQLAPGHNAPTIQTAASLVAASLWMLDNPHAGLCLYEDLPYEDLLYYALPLLGETQSRACTWPEEWVSTEGATLSDTQENWQLQQFLL